MKDQEEIKKEQHHFQKEKIILLNTFFMKSIIKSIVFLFITLVFSIVFLFTVIGISDIDQTLKISLISMLATYILTMSKTIIDKILSLITYLIQLLSEEQRGFNKNIGIEIDDVEFETTSDTK